MKTKTKIPQPTTRELPKPRSDSKHLRELHEFIRHVMRYAEQPANWPLTQQEQISFVRDVLFKARKIQNSEGFVAAELTLAVEDLAMAS